MTKTFKDKLVTAVISAITTLMVGLILLSFTNLGDSKKEVFRKLDQKVDKVTYEAKCKDINQRIDSKADKDVIKTMSEQIQFLYENEIRKSK